MQQISLKKLVKFCDNLLNCNQITDFPKACNGLQVANNGQVTRIGAAVDANLLAIKAAAEKNVDFLIVHHGLHWSGDQNLVGNRYEMYRIMIESNMAIYSVHLPLDAHPRLGHNAQIAQALKLETVGRFCDFNGEKIGMVTSWEGSREKLHRHLQSHFPLMTAIEFGSSNPAKVGILSGSGGNSVMQALMHVGADTLITGELRYSAFGLAQEHNLNLYACGHYATETFGVKAVARTLNQKFYIPWHFVDVPTSL